MKIRGAKLSGLASLAIALLLVGMVSASQAVTITGLSVDIGLTHFQIWDAQIGAGLTVTGNDRLYFTQNGGASTGNYNFDTSDVLCNATAICPNPIIHVTTTAGIFNFTDDLNILHVKNTDPGGSQFNEAQAYAGNSTSGGLGILSSDGTFRLSLGYADDAHTNACLDAATGTKGAETAGNCHPDPFPVGGLNFFGNAITGGCARANITSCFDAGVLEINAVTVATPEPASMFLLGTGLLGLAVWGRKRMTGQAQK